jgi:hypothetical protein
MSDREFTLTSLACVLESEAIFAEALGITGVSTLGDAEATIAGGLQKRAQQFLGDRAVAELHQWGGEIEPRVTEVAVELAPPKRHLAWSEPIQLKFPAVHRGSRMERLCVNPGQLYIRSLSHCLRKIAVATLARTISLRMHHGQEN